MSHCCADAVRREQQGGLLGGWLGSESARGHLLNEGRGNARENSNEIFNVRHASYHFAPFMAGAADFRHLFRSKFARKINIFEFLAKLQPSRSAGYHFRDV